MTIKFLAHWHPPFSWRYAHL